MFTKRELYLISSCLFDRKNSLMRKDEGSKIKMTQSEFDEYFELLALHLKIKDFINER